MYRRNCEIKTGIEFPEGMQRVALGLEYNGSLFHGFQKQQSASKTIQADLEKALSSVANETITTVCAGRTDAGVHATNQVLHFDTLATRPEKAWLHGVNSQLPDGLRVLWARNITANFHARFSATARTYRYLLYASEVRPAILYQQLSWTQWELDAQAMHAAAQLLVGERDFSSFRAAQCQAASPLRTIHKLAVWQQGPLLIFEIKANAFLYHMVRNIVGALVEIGRGARNSQWLQDVLNARDRSAAPAMASAAGLYLVKVDYPEVFSLPQPTSGPLFIEFAEGRQT